MRLLKFEIAKLLRAPAIPGFIAACLVLNIIVIISSSQSRNIDYLNEVAKITGPVYGTEYTKKLQSVRQPSEYDYQKHWLYEDIVRAAENSANVFAEFDTDKISEKLHENSPYSNITMKIQQWKYDLLTSEIDAKARAHDGDSVYFSAQSMYIHVIIFGTIGKLLATECGIFFILIMLWALGFENMAGTGLVAYSTKTGRKLVFHKTAAALMIGTAFFVVIYATGYGLTFAINDFSQVWGQNVSAQYNAVYDNVLGSLPFITWSSMTVGGYFFASVGIAFLNCVVIGLFAVPFGLLIKNVYAAFCSIAGIAFLHFMFYMYGLMSPKGVPLIWNISLITPLAQILNNTLWFTDGGMRMLLPRFEMFYPLICVILLCPVLFVAVKKFTRKEIY
ncbi:MAG: hypothetical protein LBS84_04605 [Clostridiales bacterium]|jgi:hypothetical protein|nr:hypothetical protein [Clostridiales bacterium]